MSDNATSNTSSQPRAGKLAYTISEWCSLSGLGRSTTYEEFAKGRLRAVKCGDRTLILAAEARRFLNELPALAPRAARPLVEDRP